MIPDRRESAEGADEMYTIHKYEVLVGGEIVYRFESDARDWKDVAPMVRQSIRNLDYIRASVIRVAPFHDVPMGSIHK
jgi:hypothetical protein